MLKSEHKTTLDRKIERFRGILNRAPEDTLTALALAEASFRRGLRLEALTAYQEVSKKHSVAEAHLAIAQIYSRQGMLVEGYEEIARLLELEPENIEARLLAQELEEVHPIPEGIRASIGRTPSLEAIRETRLRVKIQRGIFTREIQELTRNATLEPGEPIHEYYLQEAKKRLARLDEVMVALEEMERNAEKFLPPKPDLMAPFEAEESEQVASAEEDELVDYAPEPAVSIEPVAEEAAAVIPLDPAPLEELPLIYDDAGGENIFNTDIPPEYEDLSGMLDFEGGSKSDSFDLSHMFDSSGDEVVEVEAHEPVASLESELETEPAFEPAFEPEPEPEPEPELEAETAPTAVPDSAARDQFYVDISSKLEELTSTLSKTRGVTSIFVVSRRGRVVQSISEDAISAERVGETVVEGLDFLETFAQEPAYWVLECDGGIFIMQIIDPQHVVVAIGQKGANFGALRFTLDKSRPKFSELLADLPG